MTTTEPRKTRPAWITPTACAAAGLLAGSLLTGGIASAQHETQIDHCATALDTAEQVFTIAADTVQAAVQWDSAGINAGTTQIERITPAYHADSTECRGTK